MPFLTFSSLFLEFSNFDVYTCLLRIALVSGRTACVPAMCAELSQKEVVPG
jgi:hypothetical protein